MIAYVKGPIVEKTPTSVVIECGNIGYEIIISLHTYSAIHDKKECKLFTYFHVKEDMQVLYGFAEPSEKHLFVQLISVSGIGPNTGRMILSSMNPKEVRKAIILEDDKAISTIKGIGPKSAKRMILELKDKLAKETGDDLETFSPPAHNTYKEEALVALGTLGFSRSQAEKAINKTLSSGQEDLTIEELIKQALKNM